MDSLLSPPLRKNPRLQASRNLTATLDSLTGTTPTSTTLQQQQHRNTTGHTQVRQ